MSPRPHRKRQTLAEIPFRELVRKEKELRKLREKYAALAPEDHRKAVIEGYMAKDRRRYARA